MRFARSSILATLIAMSLVSIAASAQSRRTHRWETGPSRFTIVGDLLVAQPKGEFATQIDTQGFGGNVAGLFRLDREGIFSIRGDIGGMQYGSETLHVPYLPITGRVSLDVETTNSLFWGSIGPQITAPVGRFQPYINAAVGVMDFTTQTSVRGSDSDYEYASTTNKDDATSAYIFGGGVYIPLGRVNEWKLHVGARYFYGGEASYLKEGDIRDNPDGSITLFPRTSKTDQVTWQLGVSYTFPLSRRR
ncbi:MAG TPA: outer membrane beta-barrel protein [Gemmatimonadaceae bacterium]|nr:outer membrane beta-barrel protein [Gemmatimonadaceae bacterium]